MAGQKQNGNRIAATWTILLAIGLIVSTAYAAHFNRKLRSAEERIDRISGFAPTRTFNELEAGLRAELAQTSQRLDETLGRLSLSQAQMQTLEAKWRLASEGVGPLKELIDEIKAEHVSLKRDMAETEAQRSQTEERISSLERSLASLQQERDSHQKRAGELSSELETTKARVSELQKELAGAREQRKELETNLTASGEAEAELRNRLNSAEKEKAELQERLASIEKQYSEHRNSAEDQLASLRNQVEMLSSEKTALESRIKMLLENKEQNDVEQ